MFQEHYFGNYKRRMMKQQQVQQYQNFAASFNGQHIDPDTLTKALQYYDSNQSPSKDDPSQIVEQ